RHRSIPCCRTTGSSDRLTRIGRQRRPHEGTMKPEIIASRCPFDLSIGTHHVLQIPLILVANVLEELRVRSQVKFLLKAPWLGVNLRVIYRELDLQMPEIPSPEAFDNVERVAVRAASWKNGFLIVEARRVVYQRVAVPFSD